MPISKKGAGYISEAKTETLTYVSGTPGEGEFTHSATHGSSGTAVTIDDIKVIKIRTVTGESHTKIFVNMSYLQWDDEFSITLPTGTLTKACLPTTRAFRPELNISAHILAGMTAPDTLYVNRDNDITGDSPCHFVLEGVGVY